MECINNCDSMKYINFQNSTDLPVMIDAWVDNSNMLHSIKINPNEKKLIHSSVGEWHLHAMFHEEEDTKLWKEKELQKYVCSIGKFRSIPCASGNYSWLEWDDVFECNYVEQQENSAKATILFSQKEKCK